MSNTVVIVTQDEEIVKQECDNEHCHEEVFCDGLCWDCFNDEVVAEWDAQAAEREAALEGAGYLFGDPVDRAWWGNPVEEVCQ